LIALTVGGDDSLNSSDDKELLLRSMECLKSAGYNVTFKLFENGLDGADFC